jgi:3-oxoacyl-[acyl-carrier protein] reductase
MQDLVGKNAIITGASQGLGLAIAKTYAQNNINVLICARDISKLKQAKKEIESLISNSVSNSISSKVKIYIKQADISKESEVKLLCDYAFEVFGQVHILVNNAGIYGPMGLIEDLDWTAWQECMNINLYGSVLMCRYLLPHFKKHKSGKIIQLGGGGFSPMPYLTAYAASKVAIIRFINSMAEFYAHYNIDMNSITPGLLDTRMLNQALDAGATGIGQAFYDRMLKAKNEGKTDSLKYGQALSLFLASSRSNGITGKFISAIWDNYEEWANHLDELKTSDVFTLKRITGKDRNFLWGDK